MNSIKLQVGFLFSQVINNEDELPRFLFLAVACVNWENVINAILKNSGFMQHMPVVLALGRHRQENWKFQAILGYIMSSRRAWTT